MESLFLEQIVKKGTKQKDQVTRVVIVISALIICVLPSLINIRITGLVTPVVVTLMVLAVWILWRRASREYEYIFTDGSLDIDVIYNRSSRVHVVTFDCPFCRLIAPATDERYQKQIYEQKYDKTIYAGKGSITDETYVIIGNVGDKLYRVFIDPNEKILDAMYAFSPKNMIR